MHFRSFCEGIVHWADHRADPATVDAIRTEQQQGEKGGQITPSGRRSSLGENDGPSEACGGTALSAASSPARASTPKSRAGRRRGWIPAGGEGRSSPSPLKQAPRAGGGARKTHRTEHRP